MFKKVAVGGVILLLLTGIGVYVRARSVFESGPVRNALASQLSRALGQPVSVGSVKASVYPRVTVTLRDVSIGEGDRITLASIDVGVSFTALFTRRIEHGSLRVAGARLQWPLPNLALGAASEASASARDDASPMTLVSLDEVTLADIQLVSRGRTLQGEIDLLPHGTSAVTVRRIALTADGAHIDASGEITSLAGPVGRMSLSAGSLDLDELFAFASDFVSGDTDASSSTASSTTSSTTVAGSAALPARPLVPAGGVAGSEIAPGPRRLPSPLDLTIALVAERASMSGVMLERLSGTARLRAANLDVQPMTFGLFGGTYSGSMRVAFEGTPTFTWNAALTNVDLAAVTTFAGSPGVVTGRANGQFELVGAGLDAAAALKAARGEGNIRITSGVVKNLALVKSAVAATSFDPQAVVSASQGPHDEPFTEMAASLAVAGGTASTPDLHFISPDIRFDAGGGLRLDGSAVNLVGTIQMSEAMSKQVNGAGVRFVEQNGRITLPATVRGVAGKYSIEVDAASMAVRPAVR